MDRQKYYDYIPEEMERLLAIKSPSGYHYKIQQYLKDTLSGMGFEVTTLRKGGVIADLGGEGHPLMLLAHVDTLGAFVHYLKDDGRVAMINGTFNSNNIETENAWVITRDGKEYEGTVQLVNASVHVNKDINAERKFDNLELVLDEEAKTVKDLEELGIAPGDFIALDPRFKITETGYIKSRFLDDKASAAVLLGIAKYVSEHPGCLKRSVRLFFTVFEEIGHGAAAGVPEDVEDILAVDMGCVGEHLTCTEKQVSICTKDSAGAYNYEMVNELIATAKEKKIDYALDVYPSYGSDAGVVIKTGHDVRHALIGQGVYASHGYERTHLDGVRNTFELALNYII